jgi:hypothetical protein
MPKSEIKKNPKPVKKATSAKKSSVQTRPIKAKATEKKVIRANGKVSVRGSERKLTGSKKSLSSKVTISKNIVPTTEQITARAHQLWVEEGFPEGRADVHWRQAEKELSEV